MEEKLLVLRKRHHYFQKKDPDKTAFIKNEPIGRTLIKPISGFKDTEVESSFFLQPIVTSYSLPPLGNLACEKPKNDDCNLLNLSSFFSKTTISESKSGNTLITFFAIDYYGFSNTLLGNIY